MPPLNQFLTNFKIRKESLESIKKRVYVVGKFKPSEAVRAYLFTNNQVTDNQFRESERGALAYAAFIKKLRPELSEIQSIAPTHTGPGFPSYTLTSEKRKEDPAESYSSYIIDTYNYFDVRASSNSDQEAYQKTKPTLNSREFLAPDKLVGEPRLQGKEIYKQIRKNLRSFCDFQARNFELVMAFTTFLSQFAGKHGVPNGFTYDTELPGNFIPVLIDFLYDEKPIDESGFKEKLKLIDFASNVLFRGAAAENEARLFAFLQTILEVFKNYLADPASVATLNIEGCDVRKVLNTQNGIVSEELRTKFVAAMEAFNMLMQIVQSKVLLSMVLRWAVTYFETGIPRINDIAGEQDKNKEREKIILKGEKGLVAIPREGVGLPAGYSITALKEDFTINFERLLLYVASPTRYAEHYEYFNPNIQRIADGLVSDVAKRETIQKIIGAPETQRKAMMGALLTFFTDIVLPKLFKSPGLSEEELIKKFREYEMDLFLSSAMIDISNLGTIDEIVEKTINKDELGSKSREEMIGEIIDVFVGILVAPAVQERVDQAIHTLKDHQLLRELIPGVTSSTNHRLGIGSLLAIASTSPQGKFVPGERQLLTSTAKSAIAALDIPALGTRQDVLSKLAAEKNLLIAQQDAKDKLQLKRAEEYKHLTEHRDDEPEDGVTVTSEDVDALSIPLRPDASAKATDGSIISAIERYVEDKTPESQATIRKLIANETLDYQKNLSKIFERYASNAHLPAFKSKIEALTLTWVLLLNKDNLRLGKEGSNLYDLLLDLVEKLDAENPDLQGFFKENSLTKYISKDIFSLPAEESEDFLDTDDAGQGSGFSALINILDTQTEESLGNVVEFVSELKGMRYLMDFVSAAAPDTEIIVVNAYHEEFLNWVSATEAHDDSGHLSHLLDPQGLGGNDGGRPKFPAVVYMADIAFANNGWGQARVQREKESFLDKLSDAGTLNKDGNTRILPPVCLSTPRTTAENPNDWSNYGRQLAERAEAAVCPVLIVGPSLPLNRASDTRFLTSLAAGYVFCAHLLSGGKPQQLKLRPVNKQPYKRFRLFGLGQVDLHVNIRNLITSDSDANRDYAFAGDFYLYLIALMAAAKKGGDAAIAFSFKDFYGLFKGPDFNPGFWSLSELDAAMISYKMTDFALTEGLYNDLISRIVTPVVDADEIVLRNSEPPRILKQAGWFKTVVETLLLK